MLSVNDGEKIRLFIENYQKTPLNSPKKFIKDNINIQILCEALQD